MRTTAEIVREAVIRATREVHYDGGELINEQYEMMRSRMRLAATYACEMAQANAAALLKPMTMRTSDRGTRREQ